VRAGGAAEVANGRERAVVSQEKRLLHLPPPCLWLML
jgi:hypothetical protein